MKARVVKTSCRYQEQRVNVEADINVAVSSTCDARSYTSLSLKGFSFVQVVIVAKMEHLMSVQRGIQDLEEFQFGPEGRTLPLCHSWKTQEFG